MKYLISLLLIFTLAGVDASAVVVESTPGSLRGLVTDAATVAKLTVTGSIDASDLDFIDRSMPALQTLDLSDATIAAYDGKRLRGLSEHPAGKFPAGIFTSSHITSIELPRTQTITIGDAAFAGSHLHKIVLGDNVESVGYGSFSNCADLREAVVATRNLGEAVFAGCSALENVEFTSSMALPAYAFYNCASLRQVGGSERFTAIGERGFADCTSLADINLGPQLTAIGNGAFLSASLERVDLGPCRSLATVGSWAFAHMPRLESLNLGEATEVGEGVVFECPALVSLRFSGSADRLPDFAFTKNTSMDTTEMFNPDITHIGRHALSGMAQVSTITLPPSLEYIGDNAMENMTSLATVNLASASVPATGSDVWAGVEQPSVNLFVPADAVDNYKTAPQWQEFNITGVSGVDDAVTDADMLRARFEGDMLVVEYSGIDVESMTLYDIDGSQLTPAVKAADGRVTAPVPAGTPGRVFVAALALDGGKYLSIKISRE